MQRRPQGRRVRKTNLLFYSPATACQTGAQPARRSVSISAHVATPECVPLCPCGDSRPRLSIERSSILLVRQDRAPQDHVPWRAPYPSFAVIEIFAFSTFDTGQPFSAASAYF
jgi:hypothetical protein